MQKNFYFEAAYAATAPEGGGATIGVLRTYTKGPASVDLVIAENNAAPTESRATAGADFEARTITLHFPNGADSALVQFAEATDDTVPEGDETFVVYLANASKGYTKAGDLVITIPANDN